MTSDMVTHLPIMLRPDPARVVIRPFTPADDLPIFLSTPRSRAQRIADRVLGLDEAVGREQLALAVDNLSGRHRGVKAVLLRRFHDVNGLMIDPGSVSPDQAHLIGAYFCEEYAFEAAALFNPSIVIHPDQSAIAPGAVRFILSLRAVGEGHISSITFRTGVCTADGGIVIDPTSDDAISPRIENIPGGAPDDPGVRLYCEESRDLSEVVIYPVTSNQRHGIEDLRLTRFVNDDGHASYFGTYTAFGGENTRQELLRTTDFTTFDLTPLSGDATAHKGMALFPRRLDGRYMMLGRQDHENISLLTSTDLYDWNGGTKIIEPRWPWEFVQVGNCGSPIEIDEGWLVVMHGVGSVRTYCIGVCLLDKKDPARLLARTTVPLLRPTPEKRVGYVPNVVYSCGGMVHNRTLILPYAVADSFTTFAIVPLDRLLATLT